MTLPAELDFALIKTHGPENYAAVCAIGGMGDLSVPDKPEDFPEWLRPAFLRGRDGPVLRENPYPLFYRNGRYNPRHDAWECGQLV